METNLSLVSIALCTYNGARYLREQLDSLLNQDYSPLEIIIVDDSSSDQTLEILKDYQAKYNNIKLYINTQNIGFNANFIKALKYCKGEYIAIADQDDSWLPDKISIMIKNIGNNLLLYHDSALIDDSGYSKGTSTNTLHRFVRGNCTISLLYSNCVSGHACLLNRKLIALLPPFPEYMYYDWWLAYTAACTGKINYITQKLVNHRKHYGSATKQDTNNSRTLRIALLKLFNKHPLTPLKTNVLIHDLLNGYAKSEKGFSYTLFTVLVKNFCALFYIRKKSVVSHIKFLIRECL